MRQYLRRSKVKTQALVCPIQHEILPLRLNSSFIWHCVLTRHLDFVHEWLSGVASRAGFLRMDMSVYPGCAGNPTNQHTKEGRLTVLIPSQTRLHRKNLTHISKDWGRGSVPRDLHTRSGFDLQYSRSPLSAVFPGEVNYLFRVLDCRNVCMISVLFTASPASCLGTSKELSSCITPNLQRSSVELVPWEQWGGRLTFDTWTSFPSGPAE